MSLTVRESEWEIESVQRGVERYRAAAAAVDPDRLPSGRRVLVATVQPVASAIEALQTDALTLRRGGTPAPWSGALLSFTPEVLALVAVTVALRSAGLARSHVGARVTAYARTVCSILRDQLAHDAVRKAEPALHARFTARNPGADRRSWLRFQRRLGRARHEPWTDEEVQHVGAALLRCLVDACPTWFVLGRVSDGPAHRAPVCLLLTDRAIDQMRDIEARAELAAPRLMPMLCPPVPWSYSE